MAPSVTTLKGSVVTLMSIIFALKCADLEAVGANTVTFCPALIHPGSKELVLTLFPIVGPKLMAGVPVGLPASVTVNAFSADGRAIYMQEADDRPLEGITKIEFRPVRKTIVPGTEGFRTIWNLTVLSSGLILVSGNSKIRGECGTFEIDPIAGKARSLLAGPFPGCGGGGGAISPDGTWVLSYSREYLSIVNLRDQTIHSIDGIPGRAVHSDVTWPHNATWSPNGKWISVTLKNRDILLVDTSDTSKRKNLGTTDGPPAIWSPDSRLLLLSKSESRCSQYEYFQSLEAIEVATGKRQIIHSSHCEVGPGWFGWLDFDAVR
jgi:hypothetical protein